MAEQAQPMVTINWRQPTLLLAGLMILIIGPLFGPIPYLLAQDTDIRTATSILMVGFYVTYGIVFGIMLRWMARDGDTFADLGWRQPTTRWGIGLGLLVGVLWGVLGATGYLQFDENADLLEVSLFRVVIALAGGGLAIIEDLIVRGYLMHKLNQAGLRARSQVWISALVFALYHSLLGVNIAGFIFSLLYGAILGGLFFMGGKRSLTPVILAHSIALLIGEPFLTMSLIAAYQ